MAKFETSRRRVLAGGAAATLLAPSLRAQPAKTIKLGVLSDFYGPFAATCGTGSVVGVKLAVEDFLASNPGADFSAPWEYYNLVETVPAERALPPMDPAASAMAKG